MTNALFDVSAVIVVLAVVLPLPMTTRTVAT